MGDRRWLARHHLRAACRDPRLRCLRSETNRGGNWARNQGILHSSAEIVSFLDSDDCFLPEKLRFVLDFFAERPATDVLIDSFRVEKPAGREKLCRNPAIEEPGRIRPLVFDRTIFKATPAISARREAGGEAARPAPRARLREGGSARPARPARPRAAAPTR